MTIEARVIYSCASLAELTARQYPGATIVTREGGVAAGKTTGHAQGAAGLRGHSIDPDVYPWRVVGSHWRCPVTGELLDRWFVVGADNETAAAFVGADACRAAHRTAKFAKRKYPDGRRPRHLPTVAFNNGTTLADL